MRAATAHIDLETLRNNLLLARRIAPRSRVFAAVKANGYGHGLVRVARALSAADGLAVACLEEAIVLRDAGIKQPILLLEGVFEPAELPLCAQLALAITLHHVSQLEMLEHTRLESRLRVWLKIDTGMHRLGLAPAAVGAVWQRLRACPNVAPDIALMSHLAKADERDDNFTLEQLQIFQATTDSLPGARSLANSAGLLGWPQTRLDCVRPGLMLYGASPFVDNTAADEGLQPVMTLASRLIAINRLAKGDTVGYGRTWTCPEDMDVGVVAIGYGDGYPRHAPSGTPLLVNGGLAVLIGRVSMDMLSIDLRGHPQARVGDPVELWGRSLPVETIASAAGTIPYTLLCGITRRVRFEERNNDG